jgi:hypothetical protein
MLAEERYMDLLVASDQNRVLGKNQNKTCQEYYAVADYFDASMHYYMYEQAGDEERANIWKEKQEEAAGRMGSLSYEQSAIQTFLGQE